MPRFNDIGQTARFLSEMDRSPGPSSNYRGGGGGNRGYGYPGRGHGRGGGGAAAKYNDYDNYAGRVPRKGGGHVTFNFSDKSRSIMRKPKGPNPYLATDDDGDIKMDGEQGIAGRLSPSPGSNRGKYNDTRGGNAYRGKKWKAIRRGQEGYQSNDYKKPNFGPGWHKVMITNGSKYTREFILQSINATCSVPYRPVGYAILGIHALFFIEGRAKAEALYESCQNLKAPDGSLIDIRIIPCGTPPSISFTPEIEEKVAAVLATRYNPTIPSLTLENFAFTPELSLEYFLPIFRSVVVNLIFRLLDSALPTLAVLDLSNNRLVGLDNFAVLPKKTPNLRALSLAKNKLSDTYQLEKLKGLELQELIVQENPMCDKYEDPNKFTSLIRKIFPKLVKLDGVDIGPQISFDVEEPTKLPTTKLSYFCNEEARKVVLTFIEQYIQIYDSDDRQPLLAAYNDTAVMTLCSATTKDSCYGSSSDPAIRLVKYISETRNLLRLNDKSRKYKLFHVGKLDIVAFLSKLPKTQHDTSSFVVDMPFAMEKFITFSIFGLFKEREEKEQLIRAFQRTFVLIPQNGGFSIVNEMLQVQNPTTEQFESAFKVPAPTPSPSPIPYVQQPDPTSVVTQGLTHLTIPPPVSTLSEADAAKNQLVIQFAQQSTMNADWSRKCLEENGWNYDASARVFTELQKQGKIPPEAFIK